MAVGGGEGRNTVGWTYSILVSSGVEHMAAIRAYEQTGEREDNNVMGVDPGRRLEHVQNVITMLEAFDSAARSGDVRTGTVASEEVCAACAFDKVSAFLLVY